MHTQRIYESINADVLYLFFVSVYFCVHYSLMTNEKPNYTLLNMGRTRLQLDCVQCYFMEENNIEDYSLFDLLQLALALFIIVPYKNAGEKSTEWETVQFEFDNNYSTQINVQNLRGKNQIIWFYCVSPKRLRVDGSNRWSQMAQLPNYTHEKRSSNPHNCMNK